MSITVPATSMHSIDVSYCLYLGLIITASVKICTWKFQKNFRKKISEKHRAVLDATYTEFNMLL